MGAILEGFDVFKDDWWNPDGRLKSLHRINPLRFKYFFEKSQSIGGLKNKRVLDVGCGGGLLSEEFSKSGAIVTAIDLSETAISAAKEHAEKAGLHIDYRVASPSHIAKENTDSFDCIVACEVLEHVDGIGDFIKDISLMLKKGGLFFFSTINKTLKARFLAIFVAEDVLGMLPSGTHSYERFIKPSHLAGLLRENSMQTQEIKGMSFDVVSFGFRLTDDPSVNYLGYAEKG